MNGITLTLPAGTLEQAKQAAKALNRPVENILEDMVTTLVSGLEDVPEHLQGELVKMTWMPTAELWVIAKSQMAKTDQAEMTHLTDEQQLRSLTPAEDGRLNQLRDLYGATTLKKARAYSILSLRGGAPLLTTEI